MMDTNMRKSIVKNKNKHMTPRTNDLSILETSLAGMIMGFIAYSGSFSTVPIVFTITALIFGTKSWITIFSTAFAQLAAGYLHTHSSRTGMSVSTRIFRGFYIAKPEMRNRRQYNETRLEGLNRFYISAPMNGLVVNFMWETFTIFYIIHTLLFLKYVEISQSNILESQSRNETISLPLTKEFGPQLLLINGSTRYLAGCLSGISTGLINHLWQRYQTRKKIPHAVFNTNTSKLKLYPPERKKILSPCNVENWIKASVMISGALFFIASNIPNITGLHLLDSYHKRLIGDVLVIHGGWLFIRDCEMLLFKKPEKAPAIPLNTIQTPLIVEEIKTVENDQSEILRSVA